MHLISLSSWQIKLTITESTLGNDISHGSEGSRGWAEKWNCTTVTATSRNGMVHGSHPHRAKGQIFVFSHKPVLIWAVPRREHELRWENSLTEKLLERVSIVSHHQPKVPETVKLSALSWREHRDSVSHHLLDPVLQIFPWWNWLPGILAPKFVWNWPHVTSTSQNKLWLA